EKVTSISHCPYGATFAQSSVSANWSLLIVMPEILSGALWLFVNSIMCALPVVPTACVPRFTTSGSRLGGSPPGPPPGPGVAVGLGPAGPDPTPRPTICADCGYSGVTVKPSFRLSVAVWLPAAVGVKVISIAQCANGATLAQLSVSANWSLLSVIPEIVSGEFW